MVGRSLTCSACRSLHQLIDLSFVTLFIRSFGSVCSFAVFLHLFDRSFFRWLVLSFPHSLVCSVARSVTRWFVHSSVRDIVTRWFVHPFGILSLVGSLIRSVYCRSLVRSPVRPVGRWFVQSPSLSVVGPFSRWVCRSMVCSAVGSWPEPGAAVALAATICPAPPLLINMYEFPGPPDSY